MLKSFWISLLAAGAVAAHFAWIAPAQPGLTVGQAAMVQWGIGHEFGVSEAAPLTTGLASYALSPAGARTALQPVKQGPWLTASYTPREAGQHRFVFVHDRGIRSRTPQGMRDGGRDRNPTATQAFRSVRTGVAYALTGGAKMVPKAVGLVYELIPERTEKGVTVTLLLGGKPCAGGEVTVSWSGKKEVTVGKTGADGRISYRVPAGAKGPLVILAEQSVVAAKGTGYDTDNYQTALYLNW
ncbi:MAG: DUF4198 domain-containing protein [Acidobacteriaceae bacterium]|nr:DUF4198 domain-containing protein [Acidobacteriaceae bacterium]